MSRAGKIKRINELAKIALNLRKTGKKIVHCHGVFDLLHPGHIRHLESAKKNGDVLVVTVTADAYVTKGPGRPIFNHNLRAEVLSALEQIDYVSIVESDSAVPAIRKIKPDFYVKGPDYRKRRNIKDLPQKLADEEKAVKAAGGKLIFSHDDIIYSSSKLINQYLDVFPPKTRHYLETIGRKYTSDDIAGKLLKLKPLKVLIIGDAIIDQYVYCLPLGKSSKEPIMVHRHITEESYLGGSLAAANHMSSLSGNVEILSVLGSKNSFENFIGKNLNHTVKRQFYFWEDRETIVKRRFLDAFTKQKLFQISYLGEDDIPKVVEDKIMNYLRKNLNSFDLVVVYDFGHGLFTPKIVKYLCSKAPFLALNVQANSANYGFNIITKYSRADYICIDEQEIRLATHKKHDDLRQLIRKIYKKMKCRNMIITRGPYGSDGYFRGKGFLNSPALTDKIVDRVGAGDALFAVTAPCMAKGLENDLTAFIGNVAGALQIQTVGNKKPVEFAEMIKFVNRLLK
ncbi:MAG: cytidyltransferase [Candidatus Gottesmanbacteria bacterium GW2011_GWA2_43_14]|uniref:Cytidyltransferase n=1 Tax=Candidatus Gottesmanbacteria bacterium GW2011_GWA2_43_14 TaxID=1618443 RepID=A0A0G1FS01_9BACT|nr:MAG: cytidyltransferase [Candidatus Gottesmanbacteria bacterium GW2011_GWA2_43_14]